MGESLGLGKKSSGPETDTQSLPRTGNNLERINAILITPQTDCHGFEFSQGTGKILSIFRRTAPTMETKRHQPQRHANTGRHSSIQNYSRLNIGTEILELQRQLSRHRPSYEKYPAVVIPPHHY